MFVLGRQIFGAFLLAFPGLVCGLRAQTVTITKAERNGDTIVVTASIDHGGAQNTVTITSLEYAAAAGGSIGSTEIGEDYSGSGTTVGGPWQPTPPAATVRVRIKWNGNNVTDLVTITVPPV